MAQVKLAFLVILLYCGNDVFAQNDSLRYVIFTGMANVEVRYGPNCMGNEQASLSCPHIIIGGNLSFLKGWSVTSEFEYEHLYENYEWSHNLNYCCPIKIYAIAVFGL
jgi:hypothetical protein